TPNLSQMQVRLQQLAERRKKARAARRKKERATVTTDDGRSVDVEAFRLPKTERIAELIEMGSWGKPDPERWLPWHLRSYNKKLVKKRKGNTLTGTGGAQGGGVAGGAGALDRTDKFQAALKAEAEGGAGEAAAAAGSAKTGNNKKGKKKK
ncbi:MAG: hypothetical protein ACPIOQ_11815, partial [Promethearchaeia archaeon]